MNNILDSNPNDSHDIHDQKGGAPGSVGSSASAVSADAASATKNTDGTAGGDDARAMFPDFALTTYDNQKVALADLAGKPTFLRFSTTHCSICKAENPMLNQLGEELKDKVNFMDINIGEQAPVIAGYVKEQHITHRIAMDPDSKFTAKMGILGTPTHFILDPKGNVCFKSTGRITEELLRQKLKECA